MLKGSMGKDLKRQIDDKKKKQKELFDKLNKEPYEIYEPKKNIHANMEVECIHVQHVIDNIQ